MSETTSKKRRLSLPLIVAGGVSSLVLALGMSPTFSAFTAEILNNNNTAGAGTLAMTETGNGFTCTSAAATCTDINKYGGLTAMKPGDSKTTTIVITNTGSVDAAIFTLTPGACAHTASTPDLCSQLEVTMVQGTKTVVDHVMASALTAPVTSLDAVASHGTTSIAITVKFVSSASDNSLQGATASQSLTWKFQS
jgi:hypothetical protein